MKLRLVRPDEDDRCFAELMGRGCSQRSRAQALEEIVASIHRGVCRLVNADGSVTRIGDHLTMTLALTRLRAALDEVKAK